MFKTLTDCFNYIEEQRNKLFCLDQEYQGIMVKANKLKWHYKNNTDEELREAVSRKLKPLLAQRDHLRPLLIVQTEKYSQEQHLLFTLLEQEIYG